MVLILSSISFIYCPVYRLQISVIRTNLAFVFGFVAVVFFVSDVVFSGLNDDAEATPEQEG